MTLTCDIYCYFQRSLMLIESLINTDLVNLDRVTHVCKDTLSDIVKLKTGNIQIKSEKVELILKISIRITLIYDAFSHAVI